MAVAVAAAVVVKTVAAVALWKLEQRVTTAWPAGRMVEAKSRRKGGGPPIGMAVVGATLTRSDE